MPIDRRLMKADLRRAPAVEPEVRLHALGFLGGVGMQLILRGSRFVWNLVLFGEPRTEIDEPAAIAAERPVLGGRRPFHIAPAGRTFHYRHRPKPKNLGAAGQEKRYVYFDVRRTRRCIQPIQKTNGATMLIAAYFRKQVGVGRQRDAHQLAWVLAIELQLEDAAHCHFGFAFGVLTSEPKQFGDAVAQWPDQR